MIVKVQRSLFSSDGQSTIMIYNKSKSVIERLPMTKEMEKWFGKRLKRYAEARLVGKELVIDHEVPDQDW